MSSRILFYFQSTALDSSAENEDTDVMHEFQSKLLYFEKQRITDIRQILLDFTLIQLKESVKSMEILTSAYNHVIAIDVEKDLEVGI